MNIQKSIAQLFKISIIVFIAIQLLNTLLGSKFTWGLNLFFALGYSFLYSFSIGLSNMYLNCKLDSIFVENKYSKTRVLLNIILSFIITVFIVFVLRVFEEVYINKKTFNDYISSEKPSNYITALIITFVVIMSIYLFHFYKAYQENKLKEQKIIASNANAQFESLKNQIDPHFLFNSLNVLSSLIEENPAMAQKFTTSLSKVYRYVLEQKDKELVSVSEEIKFAKTYMNLLKMRFENSITFDLPEFDNEEAKVVPLSLQLLLENCIKHNVVSEKKPLHIKIAIENNQLTIENNLQKKEILSDRKGVGLENIVNRYAILTKRNVSIEQTEIKFKVYLPILTKQIAIMETQNIYNENIAYEKAKERVEKLKGFYGNLIAYCIVIPILIFINLTTSNKHIWFFWPMLGWGFGLIMHAFGTFGITEDWEENKIKEIMNKNNQTNNWN